MTTKENRIVTSLETKGADNVKQDFADIGKAAKGFGDGTDDAGEKIEKSFQNVERAYQKVIDKIEDGRVVTVRDGALMTQTFEVLQRQLVATFGSFEKAPAEIQAAFAVAERQMAHTTTTVRDLTDAVDDSKVSFRDGVGQVDAMGNAIQAMTAGMPPAIANLGQMAGKVGDVSRAVDAAKNAVHGMNLNVVSANAPMATLGVQAAAVAGTLAAATKAGEEMGKALGASQDSIDEYESGIKKIGLALIGLPGAWTNAKNALAAFTASGETGLSLKERLFTSTENLKKVEDLYTQAMKDGKAGQEFYAEALRKSGGDAEALIEILEAGLPKITAQAKAIEDAAAANSKNATATKDTSTATETATASAEKHRAKIEDVTVSVGKIKTKNDELTAQIHGADYWTKLAATETGTLKAVYEQLAESAQKQLTAAGDAAAAGLQKITYVDLSKILDQVHQLQVALQQIVAQADTAKAALDRMAAAGGEGETSGDGIDHSKASTDTMSWTPGGEPSTRSSGFGVTKS